MGVPVKPLRFSQRSRLDELVFVSSEVNYAKSTPK